MPAEIYKNGAKNGWNPAHIDLKITKNSIFYSKLLSKIYFQDVF
jgi:protocatechuate 3,4-dioxygenase beta subunit